MKRGPLRRTTKVVSGVVLAMIWLQFAAGPVGADAPDHTIRQYLRLHGRNKDDVELVTVRGPQLDETLRDRKADVVAVGAWQSPITAKIAAEGGARVLFTDYDVLGDIVQASKRRAEQRSAFRLDLWVGARG
jgi:hypothetical protein